ncbi:MAG: transcription termination factor NusA [Deltaproteobacteria bacterium]|nr:transcription termination factor NusA [Deltaproteobacteria bacterium]
MILDLNHVLEQIQKDKGISKEVLIEAIEAAMMSAARKKLGFYGDLEAAYNPDIGEVELFQFRTVVEEIEDDQLEISTDYAKKIDPDAQIGDSLGEKINSKELGRIAAQTAKQVIIQKMRDAEKDVIVDEYEDQLGKIISGVVRRYEKGNLVIDLGKTTAVIYKREQVEGENYKTGDRIQAFLLEIDTRARGQMLILSRRHPQFVKALFEMEVPEIADGIVEIKSVARDPGVRSKIAVYSADSDVDPVGACVGMKGSRVQSVVQELRGEKIDIVLWNADPARFVCNAIAPAQVSKVIIMDNKHSMEIIVPDDQLSLAIGRKGQNVRLAANLTGWNIDVYSEAKVEEMAAFSKSRLIELLGVSESMATLLYGHAFRSIEEISEATKEEFLSIPGMNKESLEEIYAKATKVRDDAKNKPEADAEKTDEAQKEDASALVRDPLDTEAETGSGVDLDSADLAIDPLDEETTQPIEYEAKTEHDKQAE